jgi:negative regulator of sigma E activity
LISLKDQKRPASVKAKTLKLIERVVVSVGLQPVSFIKNDIEIKESKMNWKIVSRYSAFSEANQKRKELMDSEEYLHVKIKRMADGIFTVRIPIVSPKKNKKVKKKKKHGKRTSK